VFPRFPRAADLRVRNGSGFTLISIDAVLVESFTELADTVAFCTVEMFEGAGATYLTEVSDWLVSDPGPVKLHETPLPDGSFVTFAVMLTDRPWSVCAEDAESPTEIGGLELEQEDAKVTASNAMNPARAERTLLILPHFFRYSAPHLRSSQMNVLRLLATEATASRVKHGREPLVAEVRCWPSKPGQ